MTRRGCDPERSASLLISSRRQECTLDFKHTLSCVCVHVYLCVGVCIYMCVCVCK